MKIQYILLGLGGLNGNFSKVAWSVVRVDVINVIETFFPNGKLFTNWNTTTITLIPKKILYPFFMVSYLT